MGNMNENSGKVTAYLRSFYSDDKVVIEDGIHLAQMILDLQM